MGGYNSALPKPEPPFPYFALHIAYDTLYLAFVNEEIAVIVRQAIIQHWLRGIQQEGNENGCIWIKMSGTPFFEGGSVDAALQIKRLFCQMLSNLRALRWILVVSSDLTRTKGSSTLFFHRSVTENRPSQLVCVSLSSYDALHLVCAPEHLKPIFRDAVIRGFQPGIDSEKAFGPDYEIILKGSPWWNEDSDAALWSRKMLLELFRSFDRAGFQLYGTANLKGKADCMFFTYEEHYIPGEHSFIMVSLNKIDRLRLIDCPRNIIDSSKTLIDKYWKHGLQAENDLQNNIWEFKMKGTPWWADGYDAVYSRFFITSLIQNYLTMGWCLVSALDIYRCDNDKSILIFKSSQPVTLSHFCISLNSFDRIRLISAPEVMVDMIKRAIVDSWPPGIKVEGDYCGSHEFAINGYPWSNPNESLCDNEWLLGKGMMTFILKSLMHSGWRVICSADVCSKSSGGNALDVHSWFVAYCSSNGQSTTSEPNKSAVPEVQSRSKVWKI